MLMEASSAALSFEPDLHAFLVESRSLEVTSADDVTATKPSLDLPAFALGWLDTAAALQGSYSLHQKTTATTAASELTTTASLSSGDIDSIINTIAHASSITHSPSSHSRQISLRSASSWSSSQSDFNPSKSLSAHTQRCQEPQARRCIALVIDILLILLALICGVVQWQSRRAR